MSLYSHAPGMTRPKHQRSTGLAIQHRVSSYASWADLLARFVGTRHLREYVFTPIHFAAQALFFLFCSTTIRNK